MSPTTTIALKRAIRGALYAGVAAAGMAAVAVPVHAADDEVIQEVIVTGSFIPMNLEAPGVPVTVMSTEDIQSSGTPTDVLDVLKKVQPGFFGGLNIGSENGNISAGSTYGGSMISLRNRSTLVLINGRRAATSPVAAGGGFAFTDASLIPVSAIERIEILADGASATYGADAVGGVVNIILKKNFEGVEFGGRYGQDKDGDFTQKSFYATIGAGNDTTSVTLSAQYQKSDPLLQSDRPWSCCLFRTPSYAGIVNIGQDYYYLNPNLNAPPQNLDLSPADLIAQGIYSGPMDQGAASQFFDLSEIPTMLIAYDRKSAVLSLEHALSDNHSLFGDVMVTDSFTRSQLNAQPVSGSVPADHPFNPFDVAVTARNRFVAFPRIYDVEKLAWRGVVGAKGDIAGSWKYEVAAGWNRTTMHLRNAGLIDAVAYSEAVAAGTYNPFAREQAPGVLENFLGASAEDFLSTLRTWDATVYGDLFDLPAGPVQLAVGFQLATETLRYDADRNTRTGGWLQATPTQPFDSTRDFEGYYAEVRVPVFSDANAIPGFYALELSAAARKVHYERSRENPTVPKFTLRWQPFDDTFAIRASYSESFTAPTLYELFGPTGAGFTSSQQIDRYDANGNPLGTRTPFVQFRLQSGANADLEPSTSDNISFGLSWAPKGALEGFRAELDYYSIKEKDIIDTLPSNDVIQHVEQFGPASPFAQFVRLGQSVAGELHFETGAPVTSPGQMSNRPSDEVWLTLLNINIAEIEQDGLDLKLSYAFDTGTIGEFSAQLNYNYLLSYDQNLVPGLLPVEDLSGVYHDDYGLFPDWSAYLQLGWRFKGFSAGINATFLPSIDDVTFGDPPFKVDSYRAFDLRFGYDFDQIGAPGLRLGIGINNVTDEEPPYIESESNQNRDINTYDPIGRFYYAELSYRF
ncbi:MAG TPA: TonB-dependent receptor [Steroidobacteraceae bacterium]